MEAGVGDLVAVGVRDLLDEVVGAEASEVVGGLAGVDGGRVESAELTGQLAQVVVGEPVQLGAEGQQRSQQDVAALFPDRQAGDPAAVGADDRVGEVVESVGAGDRIVVESLDAE